MYVGVYIGCNVAMYRRVSIRCAVHTYSEDSLYGQYYWDVCRRLYRISCDHIQTGLYTLCCAHVQ
jgi:hypothetical protein